MKDTAPASSAGLPPARGTLCCIDATRRLAGLTVSPRHTRFLVLALAVGLTAAATLWPVARTPAGTWRNCLFCEERWLADALANVILFTPLRVGFGLLTLQTRQRLALGAAVAGLVKLLQFRVVPGRDASVSQRLCTIGTARSAIGIRWGLASRRY